MLIYVSFPILHYFIFLHNLFSHEDTSHTNSRLLSLFCIPNFNTRYLILNADFASSLEIIAIELLRNLQNLN